MLTNKKLFYLTLIFVSTTITATNLPENFVYLHSVDPTIIQEIRYDTNHNFIGRPIRGYHAEQCILTRPTALALHQVQQQLLPKNLSLKVFDCYRPQIAVNDFIIWSKQPQLQQMKAEFYPRVDKKDFFKLGYVAAKSGHTRGSTVDLTIVKLPLQSVQTYQVGEKLVSCLAPYSERFKDGGIDMGTGYDCMDKLAHGDNLNINEQAYENRQMLRALMQEYGFVPYPDEWWHFTLKDEPYPHTYFNFAVISSS